MIKAEIDSNGRVHVELEGTGEDVCNEIGCIISAYIECGYSKGISINAIAEVLSDTVEEAFDRIKETLEEK